MIARSCLNLNFFFFEFYFLVKLQYLVVEILEICFTVVK